jgi:hypothetical protein
MLPVGFYYRMSFLSYLNAVYIGSLIWYLLIPVLLFCDSSNSLMLLKKYEFCCCLLIDACALAACQNTDFVCQIVAWLGNLLYECLVLIRNLSWGLDVVDLINVNLKPDIYLMLAKPWAWVLQGFGSWGWSQDRSVSWLHTYIFDCFLVIFPICEWMCRQ